MLNLIKLEMDYSLLLYLGLALIGAILLGVVLTSGNRVEKTAIRQENRTNRKITKAGLRKGVLFA